jgi:hypothetical protein
VPPVAALQGHSGTRSAGGVALRIDIVIVIDWLSPCGRAPQDFLGGPMQFQRPAKQDRSSIVFPALMAYWFAYCIYCVFRPRGIIQHPDSLLATITCVMGAFSGGAWLVTTPARLKQLELGRAWMVVLVAPFALSILSLCYRWEIIGWSMLVAAVLLQGLLVFLSPDAKAEIESPEESAGRSA